MRALVCLAMVALLALLCASGDARAAEDARLREAEQLAKKKELGAAKDLYVALLDDGRDGSHVRYNLGTLCLELGDLGCAVLHLRTAARMDPRDDDVRHNLGVALDARADRLAGSPVVDPVRALGARTPPLLARLALAIPLALLGIALILLAFIDAAVRARARAMARALALASACAAVVGGALYLCRRVVEGTAEAVVVVAETAALKEPDAAAAVAFTAHAGLHGDVVGSQDGLVRLRFDNGLEAWIKESDTARVP